MLPIQNMYIASPQLPWSWFCTCSAIEAALLCRPEWGEKQTEVVSLLIPPTLLSSSWLPCPHLSTPSGIDWKLKDAHDMTSPFTDLTAYVIVEVSRSQQLTYDIVTAVIFVTSTWITSVFRWFSSVAKVSKDQVSRIAISKLNPARVRIELLDGMKTLSKKKSCSFKPESFA